MVVISTLTLEHDDEPDEQLPDEHRAPVSTADPLIGLADVEVRALSGCPGSRRVKLRPVLHSTYCFTFSLAQRALLLALRKKYLSGGQRKDVSK